MAGGGNNLGNNSGYWTGGAPLRMPPAGVGGADWRTTHPDFNPTVGSPGWAGAHPNFGAPATGVGSADWRETHPGYRPPGYLGPPAQLGRATGQTYPGSLAANNKGGQMQQQPYRLPPQLPAANNKGGGGGG